MKALRGFLRPEFLNRVDEIITFRHLSREDFRAIADIMLGELRQSLADRGLTITWDEAVPEKLVNDAAPHHPAAAGGPGERSDYRQL